MDHHTPVLLGEAISHLKLREGGVYLDCTFGSGGHSAKILEKIGPTGRLLSFDRDQSTSQWAEKFTQKNFSFINDNFSNFALHLEQLTIRKVDGFLFDLGLSSIQLDSGRGFSYREDALLDMRMDSDDSLTASTIINKAPVGELAALFYQLGGEKNAHRIARRIVRYRTRKQITRTGELVQIITGAVGKQKGKAHPSKKVFQALRIAVNDELGSLQKTLTTCLPYLSEEGRIVVISYHSLEDRIVKRFFQDACKLEGRFAVVSKKPLLPTCEEVGRNNRAHSAKLRVLFGLPAAAGSPG